MKKPCFLIEFHGWHSSHYSDKILLEALKKKFSHKIDTKAFFTNQFFFSDSLIKNLFDKIKLFFGQLFCVGTFGFYKTELKVNNIFIPNLSNEQKLKSLNFYNKFFKNKITKKKIFNLKINKVYIGDILYDSYLKNDYKETIDINDESFKIFLKKFLCLFYFWENYFKINNVKAVIVKHNTYLSGIPARIAIFKNIKSLVESDFKLYQLSKKNLKPGLQIKSYRKNFKKFNLEFKKKHLLRQI